MRKFLLYSSALAVFGLSGGVVEAACIQTPTCSSLGYTSTSSCTGGTKCPFGNYWNCDSVNKITELTNKITELEKIIEEIKQNSSSNSDILSNCTIGDILYSDMSCDPNVVSGKTPIGVIFDVTNKLAIGLGESSSSLHWSDDHFSVPGLSDISSSSVAKTDWQGKNNTRVVLEYCKAKGESCPAFEYVNSYMTEGTQAGDWYLPAMGELNAIRDNRDMLDITLGKIGGTKLSPNDYWSSSQFYTKEAWKLGFYSGNATYEYKDYAYDVRPVIDYGDWANSSAGDEEDSSQTCDVGDIFYSDKTCSADVVSGKTPIGVVFDTTNRLIVGLEQSHQYWSYPDSFNVPGVDNIKDSTLARADLDGKKNTSTILAYCKTKGKSCPAFEYVNSYKTEGTKAGDWYLPSMGELYAIYGNKGVLNVALGKIVATKFSADYYWSSSEYSDSYAWVLVFSNGNVDNYVHKDGNTFYVRPVMQY